MKVLGLTGRAGSGKDHVYKLIEAMLKETTTMRVSFADLVRYEVERSMNVAAHYIPALWEKPYSHEIRSLLQWWGTDFRRAQDENYWVDQLQGELENLEREGETDIAIVTDVRFLNEYDLIEWWNYDGKLGEHGHVVEVVAGKETRQRRLGGILPPDHASENPLECNWWINNAVDGEAPFADRITVEFLGGNGDCYHCRRLTPHTFHDNGDVCRL